jgi:hypothetical protein
MSIAREKGHESCAASANSQDCHGVLMTYDIAAPNAVPPAPSIHAEHNRQMPPAEGPPPANSYTDKQKKEEPKTLVEFSKQTVKATQKGINKVGQDTNKALKNTGETIGGFAGSVGRGITNASKTTFKCITSLFSDCTSE